jgi:hypothetical protein
MGQNLEGAAKLNKRGGRDHYPPAWTSFFVGGGKPRRIAGGIPPAGRREVFSRIPVPMNETISSR